MKTTSSRNKEEIRVAKTTWLAVVFFIAFGAFLGLTIWSGTAGMASLTIAFMIGSIVMIGLLLITSFTHWFDIY